jgi:hypothetical protein
MDTRSTKRFWSLVVLAAIVALTAPSLHAADMSDGMYQAKKRVNDADAQLRKAMAGLTIEANRIAKAVEETPAWQKAITEFKAAQARNVKASNGVKATLAADPNYKKAVAEHLRLMEQKEVIRSDPKSTPEQRTDAAVATLNAAGAVSKLEQQAMEDDPEVAKAKAGVTQAQFALDELRRAALAQAAKDPGIMAAKQKIEASKVQLADAEKQFQDAKKQQAKADEQKLDDEIQKGQNAVFDPTRRR